MKLGLVCAAFVLALGAPSQAAAEKPLFAASDTLHIVIQAPLSLFE